MSLNRIERHADRPRTRLEGSALADVLINLEARIKEVERDNEFLLGRLEACARIEGLLGKCLTPKGREKFRILLARLEQEIDG